MQQDVLRFMADLLLQHLTGRIMSAVTVRPGQIHFLKTMLNMDMVSAMGVNKMQGQNCPADERSHQRRI